MVEDSLSPQWRKRVDTYFTTVGTIRGRCKTAQTLGSHQHGYPQPFALLLALWLARWVRPLPTPSMWYESVSDHSTALSVVSPPVGLGLFRLLQVRRRMQIDGLQLERTYSYPYRSTWDGLRTIFLTEGWKTLFRGLHINYIKVVPLVSVSFTVNDLMRRWVGLKTEGGVER